MMDCRDGIFPFCRCAGDDTTQVLLVLFIEGGIVGEVFVYKRVMDDIKVGGSKTGDRVYYHLQSFQCRFYIWEFEEDGFIGDVFII